MTPQSPKPNYRVLRSEDGTISVFLYATRIARTDGSFLLLNSGGWRTATTKRYLNRFLKDFSIPLAIEQMNYKWCVVNLHTLMYADFFDDMTINLSEVSS